MTILTDRSNIVGGVRRTSQKDLNDKNIRQTRTSFVINYTITIFAVASLLITAFTSLQAQESAVGGGGGGQARRLLVATETSPADLNNQSGPIQSGSKKAEPSQGGQQLQLIATSGQATLPKPGSIQSDPTTRSTRQTRATTRKLHSTTVASGGDDDTTTQATTLEPGLAAQRASSADADQADIEPSGKTAIKAKDKKKSQAAKQRKEEEDETDEVDEDEEKERERERARRRKLRNRLKTSTTTSTTTTRAPTSTTSTSSTSTELISSTSPATSANKNITHQHQNTSISQHPANFTSVTTTTLSPAKQSNASTESKGISTAQEKLTNTTHIKPQLGRLKPGSVSRIDDTKGIKPTDSMVGDIFQSTPTPAPIANQSDPMAENRPLSDLISGAISEHANNNMKTLGDSMKHFKLICSVSTAPISASEVATASKVNDTTGPNANVTSPMQPFNVQGQNSSTTSMTMLPSNLGSNLTLKQTSDSANSSSGQFHGATLVTIKPNSAAKAHDKFNTTDGGLVNNRKSNGSLDNSHLVSMGVHNSTIQGDQKNNTGINNGKSSPANARGSSNDHEKLENHVKEQTESLRHFIVICSLSVVLATSLVVGLITLLLR